MDVGTVAGLVCVLGSVGGRSKLGEGFDGAVGKAGEEFGEVAADGDIEPAAAFDDREDSGDLGAGLLTTEVQPVFLPIAIGLIEFSARLLLNSSSGYSRNRVSLGHSESV